jgi:hypothetical protein
MKPKVSLPCSQDSALGPHESIPHLYIPFLEIHFIIIFHPRLGLPSNFRLNFVCVISAKRATCPVLLTFLDLITVNSETYEAPHYAIFTILLIPPQHFALKEPQFMTVPHHLVYNACVWMFKVGV